MRREELYLADLVDNARWARCRGGSQLGEGLNGDVRIRRGKRGEVIRVAGEHNAACLHLCNFSSETGAKSSTNF